MLKVFPIAPWQIFAAKVGVHMAVTAVPAVFCSVAFAIAGKVSLPVLLYLIVAAIVFTLFSGLVGLLCNLRFPNLNWTNEVQAVKQNMSIIVATFAPWVLLILLAVVCAVMRLMGDPVTKCLTAAMMLTMAVICLLIGSLLRSGTRRFLEL